MSKNSKAEKQAQLAKGLAASATTPEKAPISDEAENAAVAKSQAAIDAHNAKSVEKDALPFTPTAEEQAKMDAAKDAAIPVPGEKVKQPRKTAAKDKPVIEGPTPEEKALAKSPGKIAQILEHHLAGKTNKEIAELPVIGGIDGEKFHPTTIAIQVSKYKKGHPEKYEAENAAKKAAKEAKVAATAAAKEAKEKAAAAATSTPTPAVTA